MFDIIKAVHNDEKNINLFFWQFESFLKLQHFRHEFNFSEIIKSYKELLLCNTLSRDEFSKKGYYALINMLNVPVYFIWDVKSLEKVIKTSKISTVRFKVSSLTKSVNQSEIITSKLTKVDASKPIFVANVCFSDPHRVIVDGNHRIMLACKKKTPEIKGYSLQPNFFMSSFTKESQVRYKVFSNLHYMVEHYINNSITYEELESLLYSI